MTEIFKNEAKKQEQPKNHNIGPETKQLGRNTKRLKFRNSEKVSLNEKSPNNSTGSGEFWQQAQNSDLWNRR